MHTLAIYAQMLFNIHSFMWRSSSVPQITCTKLVTWREIASALYSTSTGRLRYVTLRSWLYTRLCSL